MNEIHLNRIPRPYRPALLLITCLFLNTPVLVAQLSWRNADSAFQPLPPSAHVYFTDQKIDTGNFQAYYLVVDVKDRHLEFTVDTTARRRITPMGYFERNGRPLAVVNCSFFSFGTQLNLNLILKHGKILGYNLHSVAGKGKDTLTYRHPLESAFGIDGKRKMDVAWTYTDSSLSSVYAVQSPLQPTKDSVKHLSLTNSKDRQHLHLAKWKMETAVGGGPVLVQQGMVAVTNEEELKFAGKAIRDKHPRTAMGYTQEGRLIILLIQGRSESSGGATLPQTAQILRDLGCIEALNLDGGGSSCMLVNGKETIKPSDKEGERPVPSVFLIKIKD